MTRRHRCCGHWVLEGTIFPPWVSPAFPLARRLRELGSRASAAFALLTRNVYAATAELMVLRNSLFKLKHGSLHDHQILLAEGYSLCDNRKSPDSGNADSLKQRRWRKGRSLGGTGG